MFLQVVLSQNASIRVRVVTTDDNYSLDTELFANLDTVVELPSLFEFGTTGTDDIESTGVTVLVDDVTGEFLVLTVNQTTRATQETVQFVVWIEGFEAVIETGDNVVTTGSLTTGKDNAYIERLIAVVFTCRRFHGNNRQTIRVREQSFDLFLISYRLCFLAFHEAYCAL